MSERKKIYFLSALVLIIGCYALNLSYSLFVQTEERDIVESVVPSLLGDLSINSIVVDANSEIIIKENISNVGEVAFNYAINHNDTDCTVSLLDYEDNTSIGVVDANSNKDIFIYIKNNDVEHEKEIKFILSKYYTTLNNNITSNISNEEKLKLNVSPNLFSDLENSLLSTIYSNSVGYTEDLVLLSKEEIIDLLKEDTTIKLPVYSNSKINVLDDLNSTIVGLFKTKDNDGNSYYYRNEVENNYVSFNDMLWRIVRINGDNSIKIMNDTDLEENTKLDEWYKDNIKEESKKLLVDINYCNYKSDEEIKDSVPNLECEKENLSTNEYSVLDNHEILLSGLENGKRKIVLSLNKDVSVTSGNGTKDEPYIISLTSEVTE